MAIDPKKRLLTIVQFITLASVIVVVVIGFAIFFFCLTQLHKVR